MAIVIPVNTYIVTLNGVKPSWTDEKIRSAFQGANRIWSKNGITFSVRSVGAFSNNVAGSSGNGALNEETFANLVFDYPGNTFPAVYFVNQCTPSNTGLSTVVNDANWVSAIPYSGDNQLVNGKLLAHELGHLLNLDHVNGNYDARKDARMNLMVESFPSGIELKLNADQIKAAKSSALARKFGG